MENFLFKINNLECSYDLDEEPVISISDLEIPKGKITVILGQSGSGKSTLLETLGLMNNTIKSGDVVFSNHNDTITIDKKLWDDFRRLSEIRKKHFSFIFQDDYLMPYYSSDENMLVGHLIQKERVTKKIMRSLLVKMKNVKLIKPKLRKCMPYEMAGGQKQRLSFIRAILKDFTVLFGDEPTGNLDEHTSRDLMDVLRNSMNGVYGDKEWKSAAVIVSHNIQLSVAKADKIIVLTPVKNKPNQSEVKKECTFEKEDTGDWKDGKGNIYFSGDLLVKRITEILKPKDKDKEEQNG